MGKETMVADVLSVLVEQAVEVWRGGDSEGDHPKHQHEDNGEELAAGARRLGYGPDFHAGS